MKADLEKYLPHRKNMLLLDRLVFVDESKAQCEVVISKDSQFFESDSVPGWIGIEYMAQAIAAYSGFLNKSDKPSIGFLLGARRYKSQVAEFLLGQKLLITVEPLLIDEPIGNFKAKIEIAGNIVAESSLTTYKPSEDMLKKLREEMA